MEMMEEKNVLTQYELKKHVAAIHSSGTLTLLQRKIANTLLYNAYNELLEKDEFSISIKSICALIGYESNDYKTVKTALIKLLSTVIEWNLIDKNTENPDTIWNASSIIADARIENSICTYSYSKRMKELLYRPEMYGRINLSIQSKFQSGYALALYENCIRYKNLSSTPWIEFSTFRKLMGVDENKYIIFRDFKRRVLDKSVNEVNQVSDIYVEPDLLKEEGKISHIRFCFKKRKNEERLESHSNLITTLINDFLMKKPVAKKIISQFGEEKIKEKINYIKVLPSFKNKKIKNVSGYLVDALKFDFSSSNEEQEDILLKTEKRLTVETILENFNKLSEEEKKKINNEFCELIKDQKQHENFLNYGLCNAYLSEDFVNFVLKAYPDVCQ